MVWIGIPVGLYLLLCLVMFLVQDALLFPGAGRSAGTVQVPAGVTLRWLTRPGGERFRVAESGPASPVAVMVFFIGNGEDMHSAVLWAQDLVPFGLHMVVAEYPGYGESDGAPGVSSLLEVAESTGDYGAERARELSVPLMVGGSSLGTFCAVHLAAQGRGERLLLKAPLTSTLAAARRSFPWLPVGWILRHRFDSLANAPKVQCPTLIVHGERDSLVPISMGRELCDAIAGPARLLAVAGHGHNDDSLSPTGPVAAEVRDFLRGK